MPERIARANARRSAVRSAVEHVFAGQKHRMGLLVRTIGMANLAYNFQRLAWLEGRTAPA
ncbi:hypothetical protein HNO88_004474 [Novosphingobium chloroacetimidivorans]|uniref:Transposase DDE domain-containing protein n=1 Tax=Novosphingobium chloroacetimidivorans TaxID=1428314 RepID=A0A7W7KEN3_9SPHN|nr:hypothetical protein [Novosphingobium chloroacetimidivorans]